MNASLYSRVVAVVPIKLIFFSSSQTVSKEFEGFQALFQRYLQETGPSVIWEDIKPPPAGSVRWTGVCVDPGGSERPDHLCLVSSCYTNPFTPKSDQFQISPAASLEI